MKTIILVNDYAKDTAKLKGKFPDPLHALTTLDEDARLVSPDGVEAIFLKGVIPTTMHCRAYKLLKNVKELPNNRPTAMGTISLPLVVKKDGSPSLRSGANELVSRVSPARYGILGWNKPHERTRLTKKHPEMLNGNRALIELADTLYAENLGASYAKRCALLTQSSCQLWGTAFVNAYVARSFRTAYHRDGNLSGAKTAITPLGNFSGGALVLLRWRVAIPYQPGDIVIFNAEDLHGNLPFEGKRISLALYVPRWVTIS